MSIITRWTCAERVFAAKAWRLASNDEAWASFNVSESNFAKEAVVGLGLFHHGFLQATTGPDRVRECFKERWELVLDGTARRRSSMGGIPPPMQAMEITPRYNNNGESLKDSRRPKITIITSQPGSLVWALIPTAAIASKVTNSPMLTTALIVEESGAT